MTPSSEKTRTTNIVDECSGQPRRVPVQKKKQGTGGTTGRLYWSRTQNVTVALPNDRSHCFSPVTQEFVCSKAVLFQNRKTEQSVFLLNKIFSVGHRWTSGAPEPDIVVSGLFRATHVLSTARQQHSKSTRQCYNCGV